MAQPTKKLFVSQLMKDRTKEEIMEERKHLKRLAETILGEPVTVLETFFGDFEVHKKHDAVHYLGMSLLLLSEADYAIFGDDWDLGRGTVIEHETCMMYKIPILNE